MLTKNRPLDEEAYEVPRFQPSAVMCQESMSNFRAWTAIQKDLWSEYDRYIAHKMNQPTGRKVVMHNLTKSMQMPEKLNRNRRSHPDIVMKCSNAFYNSEMKPCRDEHNNLVWTEPADFPLAKLRHRIIFAHLDSSKQSTQSSKEVWRNEAELLQTQNLKVALMELGIPSEDILLLAASAHQAGRMKGLSVPASQGSERRVMIYTMTSYGKATYASGRQSLRGDMVNTATTRAQSLALIVGDTNAVRKHISLDYGTRQLLMQCPVVPVECLLHHLKSPIDFAELNTLCETTYMSDKKRKCHASTPSTKLYKIGVL